MIIGVDHVIIAGRSRDIGVDHVIGGGRSCDHWDTVDHVIFMGKSCHIGVDHVITVLCPEYPPGGKQC